MYWSWSFDKHVVDVAGGLAKIVGLAVDGAEVELGAELVTSAMAVGKAVAVIWPKIFAVCVSVPVCTATASVGGRTVGGLMVGTQAISATSTRNGKCLRSFINPPWDSTGLRVSTVIHRGDYPNLSWCCQRASCPRHPLEQKNLWPITERTLLQSQAN